jgi:hypothetical protein
MSIRVKINKSSSLSEEKRKGPVRTNCKLKSIDTEQELEKRGSGKNAKQVPVWKQTREVVCDLRSQLEETNEENILVDRKSFNILLDKASVCLDLLIKDDEELEEQDRHGNETKRERHEVFGPLMKSFYQLSKGIYEKKNKKPLCSPRGMNPHHDKDGEFTTKEKAKSWSVRQGYEKKNCSSGQRSSNPSRWTSVVCGRKNRLDPDVKAPNTCKKTDENLLDVFDRWSELV